MTPDCRPAIDDFGQRNRALRRQTQIVCSAERKVGEEFDIADAVRAELEVTCRDAIFSLAFEGFEINRLDAARETSAFLVEFFEVFWPERRRVSWRVDFIAVLVFHGCELTSST